MHVMSLRNNVKLFSEVTTIFKNHVFGLQFIEMSLFLLGKGRKKQIYTTDSDEISHIVNRIAPQVNINISGFVIYFQTE